MLAYRRNWSEALFPTIGLLLACALALIASAMHLNLFTLGSSSASVWFASLGALTLATAVISVLGAKHA